MARGCGCVGGCGAPTARTNQPCKSRRNRGKHGLAREEGRGNGPYQALRGAPLLLLHQPRLPAILRQRLAPTHKLAGLPPAVPPGHPLPPV